MTAFDPRSVKANQTGAYESGLGDHYFEQGDVVLIAALWANTGCSGEFGLTVTLPNSTESKDSSQSLLSSLATDPCFPTPLHTTRQDPTVCREPGPVVNYCCDLELTPALSC